MTTTTRDREDCYGPMEWPQKTDERQNKDQEIILMTAKHADSALIIAVEKVRLCDVPGGTL